MKFLVLFLSAAGFSAFAEISRCRFNYGRPYVANPGSEIDYVTAWAGYDENYTLGGMVRACAPCRTRNPI